MRIIDQPRSGSIGTELKSLMGTGVFTKLYMIVAYVREGGVEQLGDAIKTLKSSGGEVWVIAGIDQKNTSHRGLKLLLDLGCKVWVFHNENLSETFHPKVYALESPGKKAVLIVGSGNLTEGGLFTNYETAVCSELDLTDKDDTASYSMFTRMFEHYYEHEKCSKELTPELLGDLLKENYVLGDEEAKRRIAHEPTLRKQHVFGSESFSAPPIMKKPEPQEAVIGEAMPRPVITAPARGKLVWRKSNLPSSDAQQTQLGTNPTGCLRLTQAEWTLDGVAIDQPTYFRETLFGRFGWEKAKEKPFEEMTTIRFRVTIKGVDKGEHRLEVRYKPSGEARQRNYTTSISWGTLTSAIKSADLVGSTLSLYESSDGGEPFFIEFTEDGFDSTFL